MLPEDRVKSFDGALWPRLSSGMFAVPCSSHGASHFLDRVLVVRLQDGLSATGVIDEALDICLCIVVHALRLHYCGTRSAYGDINLGGDSQLLFAQPVYHH